MVSPVLTLGSHRFMDATKRRVSDLSSLPHLCKYVKHMHAVTVWNEIYLRAEFVGDRKVLIERPQEASADGPVNVHHELPCLLCYVRLG